MTLLFPGIQSVLLRNCPDIGDHTTQDGIHGNCGNNQTSSGQETLENLGLQENEIHRHFGCKEKEKPLKKDQPTKSRVD